jgi:hypothetical protein
VQVGVAQLVVLAPSVSNTVVQVCTQDGASSELVQAELVVVEDEEGVVCGSSGVFGGSLGSGG